MTLDVPVPTAAVSTGAKPTSRFMLSHPAHTVALGFGSGLSPVAPGTAGTLWAWVAFLVLQSYGMTDWGWAAVIGASIPIGWWASTVTARHMGTQDPGCIVWDEIVAFWIVLWLVMPAGFWAQVIAFALFRYFDAAKPGPVGWADRLFHRTHASNDPRVWSKAGFGIMLDDLVAAACTLMLIAVWRFM